MADLLAQLAARLDVPDGDIVTGDEVRNWPDGKLQELVAERILQEIEPGTTVVCDQCDERCSIEPQRRTDPRTGKVVGVHFCMLEEGGGRIEIDLNRLRRWKVDKKRLWHMVYGLKSEWELPWDDTDDEYIFLQEAVNLANSDSITIKVMSRLLEDGDFPVHRMRKGRRCKVHLHEFRKWLRYAQCGKITDAAIDKYLRGCDERQRNVHLKKSRGENH